MLQRIRANAPAAIRFYQQNANVEMGVLRELGKELEEPGVPLFLASMPNTPSRLLEALQESRDPQVLQALAANPNCLPRMIHAASPLPRLAAAASRRLNAQQALLLAQDPEVDVRAALARNPVIPTPVQLKLSQDCVPFVRAALLENRRLVEEFQVGLADDIDTAVHLAALLVPRLSPACMEIWVKESEELAQLALARRKDLTPEMVAALSRSAHPSVMLALLEHQDISTDKLEDFLRRGDAPTLLSILKRRDLPAPLQALAGERSDALPEVRLALAAYPQLDDLAGMPLATRARDDQEILERLAMNPSPRLAQTRLHLAETASPYLGKLLLANPLCHEKAILDALVRRGDSVLLCHLAYRGVSCRDLSPEAREILRQSPLPSVQALAAPLSS
ncbi:MAG: hypothetical protein ACI4SG_09310 [Oligosphaeraceae bacterium]